MDGDAWRQRRMAPRSASSAARERPAGFAPADVDGQRGVHHPANHDADVQLGQVALGGGLVPGDGQQCGHLVPWD